MSILIEYSDTDPNFKSKIQKLVLTDQVPYSFMTIVTSKMLIVFNQKNYNNNIYDLPRKMILFYGSTSQLSTKRGLSTASNFYYVLCPSVS